MKNKKIIQPDLSLPVTKGFSLAVGKFISHTRTPVMSKISHLPSVKAGKMKFEIFSDTPLEITRLLPILKK